ncbi:phage tail tape measure protein [cyanobacterium TDX16]|nr:phage tail tape measure protein [cyanobacterium TDX16]
MPSSISKPSSNAPTSLYIYLYLTRKYMPSIASVTIDTRLDFSGMNRDYSRMQTDAIRNADKVGQAFGKRFTQAASAEGSRLSSVMNGVFAGIGIGIANAAGQGIAALGGLGKQMLTVGAEAEKSRVAFTTFLGSAQKADSVLKDITKFAAETPFELPEVEKAARQLLAFGFTADRLKPTLTAVGNIAAGTGVNFGELADIIGKAKTQGRLYAEDINQLTGRGIPIIAELAKQYGVAESEVKKLVESGKVGFNNLEKALVSMSSEGGKFNNLMAKLADTTGGKFTNLSDRITQSFIAIFKNIQPAINAALDVAAAFFDGFRVDFRDINSLAKDFAGWLIKHKDEVKAVGAAIGSFISSALKTINVLAREFSAFLKANPAIIQAIGAAVRAVGAGYGVWGQALRAAFGLAKEIAAAFAGIVGIVARITGGVRAMSAELQRAKNSFNQWAAASRQNIMQGIGLGGRNKAPIPKYEVGTRYIPRDQIAILHKGEAVIPAKYNSLAKSAAGARGDQGAPFTTGGSNFSIGSSRINPISSNYQRMALGQNQWLEDYARSAQQMIEITEKARVKSSELKSEVLQGIGGAFTSSIKDLISGTKSLSETVLDLMGNLANKLLDLGLNSIFGSLGGAGGLFGGLTGSGLFGGGRGIPSYAVGTPYVPTNQLAYLHQGEAVVPANHNKAAATVVINNTIHNAPGEGAMTNNQADKIGEQIRRVVESELIRQKRPGGYLH